MSSPNSSTSNTFDPHVNWVPIFKGEKFEQWSMQMKSIFITQDIWDIIQEGYEKSKDVNEEASWSETKKGLYKQNLRRDNFALSIIYHGVDETILPTIMAATTAKEAWSILETKYKCSRKMGSNCQQVEITIMTQEKLDENATLLQSMESESMIYSNMSNCCIYTVPEYIRKGYEQCYRPLSTSIGPVFYKDPKLEAMQELKKIYLKGFREHRDNAFQNSFHPYIRFVSENEIKIRECYQQQFNLSSDEFIQMIVLDAAFLIYLFLSIRVGFLHIDDKFRVPYTGLLQDLFLVENQLPFFVLMGIYDIAFGADPHCPPFIDLTLTFIQYVCGEFPAPEAINNIVNKNKMDTSKISHLLDLRRECCCLHIYEQHKSKGKQIWFEAVKSYINCKNIINVSKCRVHLQKMCCCLFYNHLQEEQKKERELLKFNSAKHLRAAGVKFELSKSKNPFDITFNKHNGVLRIPRLTLDDGTESTLRNLLFFEQCRFMQNDKNYVSDYICFIDRLIDTAEDIQVLQKKEILTHLLGSDEDAANIFNKLNRHIVLHPCNFAFSNVSEGLEDYASRRRNRWNAILWSKYCNHPWAIISVIYAVILLILTVLQTITGFLQLS